MKTNEQTAYDARPTDFLRVVGAFLWCATCACLGLCCHSAANGLSWASRKLMAAAERLWDAALQVNVWD